MARYMVERNFVQVTGRIWMPAVTGAAEYPLSSYDVGNIRAQGDGRLTRHAVELWLTTHAGDFQHVDDFRASVGTWESPWRSEESACTYGDCMYPAGDDDDARDEEDTP